MRNVQGDYNFIRCILISCTCGVIHACPRGIRNEESLKLTTLKTYRGTKYQMAPHARDQTHDVHIIPYFLRRLETLSLNGTANKNNVLL